jgi:hypothetical protein
VLAHTEPEALAEAFRTGFGLPALDEFHYGHATVGCFSQLVSGVYPQARRICFGDAFGLVHWRRVRLAFGGYAVEDLPRLAPNQAGELLPWACGQLARGRGTLRELLATREIAPHEAALCMPVDQFGDYFDQVPLRVCPKATAQRVLAACADSARELTRYVGEVLAAQGGRPTCLLLTANFAEADDLSPETDIAMYADVVRSSCPPGTALLLKTHPGETLPRAEGLKKALEPDYAVVELDRRFRRYPIEIWAEAVRTSSIISLTYPSVTLAYFYDKDIIQPMSEAFIERWWSPAKQVFRRVALTWNRGPALNLPRWDGQGPLYAACPLPPGHPARPAEPEEKTS